MLASSNLTLIAYKSTIGLPPTYVDLTQPSKQLQSSCYLTICGGDIGHIVVPPCAHENEAGGADDVHHVFVFTHVLPDPDRPDPSSRKKIEIKKRPFKSPVRVRTV